MRPDGLLLAACCMVLLSTCRSSRGVPEHPPWLSELSELAPMDSGPAEPEPDRPAPKDVERPISHEPPAIVLRRRLLLDEDLPLSLPPAGGRAATGKKQGQPPGLPPGMPLGLLDVLSLGARHSAGYQRHKQAVFQAALSLDLGGQEFLDTWRALLSSTSFWEGRARASLRDVNLQLALDLVALLDETGRGQSGPLADRSIVSPMLRRADAFIVTTPLEVSQRQVVYAMFELERFKSVFVVRLASEYYRTLKTLQETETHEARYRWLIGASRRAQRMAGGDQGPLAPDDPTLAGEVAARQAWIVALEAHERQLAALGRLLGLPDDSDVRLELADLSALDESARARWGAEPADAAPTIDAPDRRQTILLGLAHRLDLRVAVGRVFDCQRGLAGPVDNVRADQTLLGSVALSESLGNGDTEALVGPLELSVGTVRQPRHRDDAFAYESTLRSVRDLEQALSAEVLESLARRSDSQQRLVTELQACLAAQRRVAAVKSGPGAAEVPVLDGLEARDLWVVARNSYATELVRQRVIELELQRDLGVLMLDSRGLWTPPTARLH